MLVVRKAKLSDVEQLLKLSVAAGTGMTTMPNDYDSWMEKLNRSKRDFSKPAEKPNGDVYFLVLEDTDKKLVVGSASVYPGIGLDRPFYTYKVSKITKSSKELDVTVHSRLLTLVNDYSGSTELGSLFVLPEYRRNGIGKFLSRSRLMLIADFPERFDNQVFAEFRGWLTNEGESPFWEGFTSKFFPVTFQHADFVSAVEGSQFIADLMPKHPVYLDILPQEAQDAVGKANSEAVGAVKILEKEGFQYTGYVDIFDAGPCVQTSIDQLTTVKNSRVLQVENIVSDKEIDKAGGAKHIISNSKLDDYSIVCHSIETLSDDKVIISRSTADSLNLTKGDLVRCAEL